MKIQISLCSKLNTIRNLKPDSVITLFHATEMKQALDMCVNGIDGRKTTYRRFPHAVTVNGETRKVTRGLFVSYDRRDLGGFGSYILKFKTLACNLIYIFPSLDAIHVARKEGKELYPRSYRPEVTNTLLNNPEKQSLFVGIADPRSIECIYYKNSDRKWIAHDRLDFIEYAKSSLKEDPEYVLTLKDTDTWETLVKRLYKFEMDYDIGIILKGLKNAKTFEKQIAVLSPSGYGGGTVYAPYSSAKKIVLELQRQGTIPKAKSTNTKQVYDESYLNSVGPTGKAYIT